MTENNKNIEEIIETKPTRRYDIDTLRVFATILLIFFHTAMLFAFGTGYFIQNDELSIEVLLFVMFVNIFHMPLFFFLAGMSTFYSLNVRTGNQYLKERVRRIVIPLILGILIVIPPIVYFERLAWWSDTRYNTENFNGTFLEFYPHFFEIGTLNWYHLWFIAYLSVFSLVALPLFLRLKKEEGKQQLASVANSYGKGKKIFLLALPLIIINVSLRWIFPGYSKLFIDDLANVFSYLTIFLFGFLIVGDIRFENSIDRNKKLALVLAVITSFFALLFLGSGYNPIGDPIGYAIYWALFSFSGWSWLIAIYGYGRKYLTKQNSIISYLSKIALPMYIIHLTVIIIIAFYVLQWNASIVVKFLIISTSSLFITILLCELIKTNNITRFIFGMRPKVKKKEI
ncbi:MAG: acyltransferase [Promethearchaeota archaeon]